MEEKKTEKLTDKAFSRLALTAVLSILLCIVFLCSSTYAWYSATLNGSENSIKTAGECLLQISVANGGSDVPLVDGQATLEKGVTYTVTLTMPKDSPSGYCVVNTASGTYRTDYLARHTDDTPVTLSFTLTLAQQLDEGGADITPDTLTVTFKTHWGIYSGEFDVTAGGALAIK